MPYGTGYIDSITAETANFTINNSAQVTGNLISTGTVMSRSSETNTNNTNLYPLLRTATVASTSGTAVTITTAIPSWATRITVILLGVSTNGTSEIQLQLGAAAGPSWQTTGYTSAGESYTGGTNTIQASSTGLVIGSSNSAASVWNIIYTLCCNNRVDNLWTGSYTGCTASGSLVYGGGTVTYTQSSKLEAIRLTTIGGVNTFDAGTVNIMYE